jgi:hypothetical protein
MAHAVGKAPHIYDDSHQLLLRACVTIPAIWAAVLKSALVNRFLVSANVTPVAVSALAWLPPTPDHPNTVAS